ncbi:hypothetical protein L3X38_012596 [Prunus dulcis]|uniref:Uncharacterized protein n=1 Tax=Prunus dulcis TaxID=3755 RepID=A0AAD4WLA0_PRUDU|nr:hypothetical protein L3X38_012596 [Prunus dulcis]
MQIVDLAPDLNLNSLVFDFFVNGWWDVEKLRSVLQEEWVQKVTSCSANFQGVLEDCHIWKPTSNGRKLSPMSNEFEGILLGIVPAITSYNRLVGLLRSRSSSFAPLYEFAAPGPKTPRKS